MSAAKGKEPVSKIIDENGKGADSDDDEAKKVEQNQEGSPDAPPDTTGTEVEVLGQESKSIIMSLLSQVRIGMDLSRVTLPTFILEPRSMLEKLTDYLNHCELLLGLPQIADPVQRLIGVVKWYLSGFYIKPKGVKKPYNPIIGEYFRCKWQHPDSQTFFVAEQVSHHPPISAFYAANRKAGVVINGSILFKSKFMGTSAASILDGKMSLFLVPLQNEEYTITFPSAYARGLLFGTLLMELVGTVVINCAKTGCKAELEFKAKPFFGGEYNAIVGKIKKGKDHLFNISGKWDGVIELKPPKAKQSDVLWNPQGATRIPKQVPSFAEQQDFESQKLWAKVTDAIIKGDQKTAGDEKFVLEENQRNVLKEKKAQNQEWVPRLFKQDKDHWVYRYANLSMYDPTNEGDEVEVQGVIQSVPKAGTTTTTT